MTINAEVEGDFVGRMGAVDGRLYVARATADPNGGDRAHLFRERDRNGGLRRYAASGRPVF